MPTSIFVVVSTIATALVGQQPPIKQNQASATPLIKVGAGHSGQIGALGLLDDDTILITSATDNSLRLWDLETGKSKGEIVAPRTRPKAIALNTRGDLLAVLTSIGKIQLLESPGKLVREWQAETYARMGSLAFSPDGKWLASNGSNTALWNVSTGELVRRFEHWPEAMGTLAFSPDGKVLCAGSLNGKILLFDVDNGKAIGELQGHTKYVDQVAFLPDGKHLASVSHDQTARLWNLETRKEIWSVQGDVYICLTPSRDGRSLFTGGMNGSIRVWELASKKERAKFQGEPDLVFSLSTSRDGKTLISGHQNGVACCWDVTGLGSELRHSTRPLPPAEFDKNWANLAGDDAQVAFQAIWRLAATGNQVVARAHQELLPKNTSTDKTVANLILDLSNQEASVRERATLELGRLSDLAWPALRKALDDDSPAETKRRAHQLLAFESNPDANRLKIIRIFEVLENTGNKDARTLVETLAKGPANLWRTQEAAQILQRMHESY
jgi:WD40 repeat protein